MKKTRRSAVHSRYSPAPARKERLADYRQMCITSLGSMQHTQDFQEARRSAFGTTVDFHKMGFPQFSLGRRGGGPRRCFCLTRDINYEMSTTLGVADRKEYRHICIPFPSAAERLPETNRSNPYRFCRLKPLDLVLVLLTCVAFPVVASLWHESLSEPRAPARTPPLPLLFIFQFVEERESGRASTLVPPPSLQRFIGAQGYAKFSGERPLKRLR